MIGASKNDAVLEEIIVIAQRHLYAARHKALQEQFIKAKPDEAYIKVFSTALQDFEKLTNLHSLILNSKLSANDKNKQLQDWALLLTYYLDEENDAVITKASSPNTPADVMARSSVRYPKIKSLQKQMIVRSQKAGVLTNELTPLALEYI